MAQHHALGRAGRARRVDQGREGVGIQSFEAVEVRLLLYFVTLGHELFPGHHHVVCDRGGALHRDDVLEVRRVGAFFLDLLPLILVLDEDDGCFGVGDDVANLDGGAGGVDTRRSAARAHCRNVHDRPLGAVESEDADRLPRFEAECDQRAPCLRHLVGVGAPVRRLPAAVFAHVVRRVVGGLLRPLQ